MGKVHVGSVADAVRRLLIKWHDPKMSNRGYPSCAPFEHISMTRVSLDSESVS
ncbi:hypothetical protein ABH994_006457 [Bradyrhizobium yuanmingense]|uniref:Uncharacterized protein n=1 Tax=Bradyrhizobium yuanmingense TaxID=108015 RepID=A0ABV4GJT5_9BRAD